MGIYNTDVDFFWIASLVGVEVEVRVVTILSEASSEVGGYNI